MHDRLEKNLGKDSFIFEVNDVEAPPGLFPLFVEIVIRKVNPFHFPLIPSQKLSNG